MKFAIIFLNILFAIAIPATIILFILSVRLVFVINYRMKLPVRVLKKSLKDLADSKDSDWIWREYDKYEEEYTFDNLCYKFLTRIKNKKFEKKLNN